MATYNGERFLRDQIGSILSQDRLPDEIVICDDASSDDTVQLLRSLVAGVSCPVLIIQNEINRGSSYAFEKAIENTHGDLVVLADQDDVWTCDKLSVIENVLLVPGDVAAVFSDAHIVDEKRQHIGYKLWYVVGFGRSDRKCVDAGQGFEVLVRHNVVTGAAFAFRSVFIERVLPIPSGWVHDEWIALIIAATNRIRSIGKPLLYYRQHGSNQIGGRKKSAIDKANISRNRSIEDEIRKLCHALNRLSGVAEAASSMRVLENKIRHLRRRSCIRYRARGWFCAMMSEVFRGNYARFSNGIRSLLSDLVLGK